MKKNNALTLFIFYILFFGCNQENHKLFQPLDSSNTNINFKNELTESSDFNVLKYGYFYNGGGVVAADFNNDNLTDLYFTGNLTSNKLYLNKGNEISFEDITDKAGVAANDGWNTGATCVDINNDGWQDIYVCRSAAENFEMRKNLLFINNKNNTFTESAQKYGLDDAGYSTQAAFFDYDKDGDLDCFILNHSIQKYAGFSANIGQLKTSKDVNYSSKLMRNDNGFYKDISDTAGIISNVLSFGLGLALSDFNNDGWTDIYVSNDYNEEDYLYINKQDGTFFESIKSSTDYTSLFSMGSDAADINNDGWTDIVTLDMMPEKNERIKMTSGDDNFEKYSSLIKNGFHHQYMRNMLQVNNTKNIAYGKKNGEIVIPQFKEIGQVAGISNTDWSWASLWGDFDLDGHKDLFITNGYAKDYTNMDFLNYTMSLQTSSNGNKLDEMEVISKMPAISTSNYAYKNKGNGSFENVTTAWGLDEITMSNGAAYADLDNDGDLDLIVNNINKKATVYKNNTISKTVKTNYLKVHLEALPSNKIGAKVHVYQNEKLQVQEFFPTRGFQSASNEDLIFGIENNGNIDSIVVIWNDKNINSLYNLKSNQKLTIKYSIEKKITNFKISKYANLEIKQLNPVFENTFKNDFKVQNLLPYAFSAKAPVLIEGVKYLLIGNKVQSKASQKYIELPISTAITAACFIDIDNDGDEDIIASNSDYSQSTTPFVFINSNNIFTIKKDIIDPKLSMYASTIVALDYDNDNDNDIFIGARMSPENYPQSSPSLLLTNEKGKFILKDKALHSLDIGMVTDAKMIDINQDNKDDLVVAREFSSVAVIENKNQQLSLKNTKPISKNGLWYSLCVADINEDGKQDVIAGNIGLNNQFAKVSPSGLKMFSNNFYGSSNQIPIIGITENDKIYPFGARDEMASQMPIIKKKFNDYASYSKATIENVIDIKSKGLVINSMEDYQTTLFQNDASGFKSIALPNQVQATPIYAIQYLDLDGDNKKEILLGGNNFQTRVRIGKMAGNKVNVISLEGKNLIYKYDIGINGEVRYINAASPNKCLISTIEKGVYELRMYY